VSRRPSGFPRAAEMEQFQETIKKLVKGMDKQAERIEAAKLKALGQRNRVESEREGRKIRAAEIQSLINEKKAALERLQLQASSQPAHTECSGFDPAGRRMLRNRARRQVESLKRVDQEQRAIVERLGNNEA
jgi:RNA-splicing ligase RtcB